MALDLTGKALNMASAVVGASDKLMQALEAFQAIGTEAADSGIDFSLAGTLQDQINAALAASSLKHVDATAISNALNSGGTIAALLAGAQVTHRRNFQKVRP